MIGKASEKVARKGNAETAMVEARGVEKTYSAGGVRVHALRGVDLTITRGEMVAVMGPSGCGKTTLARCLVRLVEPTSGSIRLAGRSVTRPSAAERREIPRLIQIVFQDPYASLNPRRTIAQSVADPLRLHAKGSRAERPHKVADLLHSVGLRPELMHRYPHELSGGQRQRVAISRALAVEPRVIVCDEPVSALDVSVQASVLNLINELQRDMGFSCLFITHDLSVVEFLADRIAVMYLGHIVETGTREQIFGDPRHPYTQALLSAAPVPDPAEQRNPGA